MIFRALNLPNGLMLNEKTGQITGVLKEKTNHNVTLIAENNKGKATAALEIRVGEDIALTPPLGWNGWNAWEQKIDREKVIASANAMIQFKLKDYGWNYVNIDDAWQGYRDSVTLALQPNEKFPDIKEMFDYIKSYSPVQNVKAGINYPATLVTTGDHDDRVVPAHSFKFAAELQAKQAGANPVLIRIETNAVHGAGKPVSKTIEEASDIQAFTLYNMGFRELPK